MCGIAGVFYDDASRPVDSQILKAMGNSIAHRGPDAEGFWIEPGLGLAHRRLSILDLAGGDQPIGNEDNSIQVVFNGELYNFHELRTKLETAGHRFRTRSDTEVLVHLYEEQGERLVESLRGMFAFALWDRKRRRLLLARDRLGIKPLYFYRDRDKLLFASEIKAILAYPAIRRQVDVASLEDYLTFGMVAGPRSIFRNIEKLPPAHVLIVRAEQLDQTPRCYWRLRIEPDLRPSAQEWQEAIRAKIDEAVRLHLIADVPVGAFLSGGLDSSVVVSTASGSSGRSLQTFSIGFHEESFSELPYARQVAKRFATRHVEKVVTPDAATLVDELVHYFDEPFADSSAIPTFLVARLARSSVKVVLSGDGGDEAFGGYARYAHDLREAAIRRLLPSWFRRLAIRPLARVWPKADWLPQPLRLKTFLTNLALDGGTAYANTLAICRLPLRRRLLAPDLAAGLNGHCPEDTIRLGHGAAPPDDPLAGMLAADMATLLPDDFLVKVDRASMAHGLEVRPPLLDHELLELAARIPSRCKVRRGQTKWLLKEAYRSRLPSSVIDRAKHGFEIPVDAWLRGPLGEMFEDAVLNPRARVSGLLNQTAARTLYRAHASGYGRHGNILWALLVLARWADRYLTGASSEAPIQSVSHASANAQPEA
jgi:asparagine synthase (glutamine-hydrolysing)